MMKLSFTRRSSKPCISSPSSMRRKEWPRICIRTRLKLYWLKTISVSVSINQKLSIQSIQMIIWQQGHMKGVVQRVSRHCINFLRINRRKTQQTNLRSLKFYEHNNKFLGIMGCVQFAVLNPLLTTTICQILSQED